MLRVGPFDKRTHVRRCANCQRRKIKCVGPVPCEYCKKTRQFCFQNVAEKRDAVVFMPYRQQDATAVPVIRTPTLHNGKDWQLAYFFDSFLKMNEFAADLWGRITPHLYELLHTSPALRDAIAAVAVLDSSRRPTSRSHGATSKTQESALKTYASSMVALQCSIDAHGATEDVIWTTFFLGLFELMMGGNSENWDRHFLYGTASLLRACGPTAFRKGSRKTLFLTLRLFEISRCLIYNQSSFLMDSAWNSLLAMLRDEAGPDGYRNETALDIMLRCSDLCSRLLRSAPGSNFDDFLEEGACLRAVIDMILQGYPEPDPKSPNDLVSYASLHAVSIYLSGIFDYRLHLFSATPMATLPQYRVKSHVASILNAVEIAVRHTRLCGLLFLFPLRVAAARATDPLEHKRIMDAFKYIGQHGFDIVRLFQQEVQEVWKRK
ncbi:c6 finger domain-containing protein [Diplodia corticola]|uniref:C6 finger domain-containing protein n=1 Tax=Diplodia corticola TaxID=236234 RepID=A0A1J9QVP2_9PEZI|nr:c6 finger domain-containing protein [Diplodia corticola]OJD32480.1 c6 finger domain-containing protein [Diplodia corticola]